MDNISRDNNSSYLPVAGVIAGALAVVISFVAYFKASKVGSDLATANTTIAAVSDKADAAETAARAAQTSSDKLRGDTQSAFDNVGARFGKDEADIKLLQDTHKAPAPIGKTPAGPLVAGKDEYVVKGGDTGTKIATATGFPVKQLEAVNPGVDWTKLKVGQKLKLPQK
jgi:LysM repeat protein